jgi:hypothetical protein
VAGRSEGSAAAWAAAAVVLALGGLGFGVAAQVRLSHVEDRLDQLQQSGVRAAAPRSAPTTTRPHKNQSPRTTTTAVASQPADPNAAKQSVIHAYQVVYDGSQPTDSRLAFIDNPTGVAQAFQAAATGQVAAQAAAIKARIDSVTFTSAEEASVRYAVLVNGVPQFDNRIGTAHFDNGVWKVARQTVCEDLTEAGAPCQG